MLFAVFVKGINKQFCGFENSSPSWEASARESANWPLAPPSPKMPFVESDSQQLPAEARYFQQVQKPRLMTEWDEEIVALVSVYSSYL